MPGGGAMPGGMLAFIGGGIGGRIPGGGPLRGGPPM